MELKNNDELQILIAKTWDFHGRINEKINQNSFSFCSHCSKQGRYCVVSERNVEGRRKMIAISDSLRELHNILVYLQRLNSSQKIGREEALGRLKESRRVLIERINGWAEKEKRVDVLEEVMKFVGEGKSDEFPWNFKIEQKNVNGVSRFLVRSCRFALEFAVIFAGIYTSLDFWKYRQQNHRLQKEAMDSRIMRKPEFLLTASDNIHLDVLCGRG